MDRVITLDDFRLESFNRMHTPEYRIPETGQATIRFSLEQMGTIIAQGNIVLDLDENLEWTIALFRQVDDPFETCVQCVDSRGLIIHEEFEQVPEERLWILWTESLITDDESVF